MKKTVCFILCLVVLCVTLSCGMFAYAECGNVKVIKDGMSTGLSQGFNVCTQTVLPYTFDDDIDYMVVASPTGEDDSNKVLKLGAWDRGRIDFDAPVEAERPVQLSFDYYSEGGTIGIRLNDYENNELSGVWDYFVTDKNIWSRYSTTIVAAEKNAQVRPAPAWQGSANETLNTIYIKIWGTEVKYIDNVSVVPYYKVTYHANDGTDTVVATDYFLAESFNCGMNITAPMREGYKLMGWATSENGEVVQTVKPVLGEDIDLYAVWAEIPAQTEEISINLNSMAGLNLRTGTTLLETFENSTHQMVVSSPTDENNKVLRLNAWEYAHASNAYGIEAERPVELCFDYYSEGGALSIRLNDYWNEELDNVWDYFVADEKVWSRYSTKIVAAERNPGGRQVPAWQGSVTETLDDVSIKVWSTETKYIDNVSLIPYYKATYFANDGTDSILATDYFLSASYTPGVDITLPVREGYKLAGWALIPNGKATKLVATTPGRDIALYAVWEELGEETEPAVSLDSEAGLNLWTGTTLPHTFENTTHSWVVPSPTDENNNVFKLEAWQGVVSDRAYGIEPERPVKVGFDYYSEGGTLSIRLNNYENTELSGVWDYFVTDKDAWSRYSTTIIAADKNPNGRQVPAWQGSVAETLDNISIKVWSTETKYLDNVSVIPYYKVTYLANNGTDAVLATDYFLAESYKPGTDITTPIRKGYNFKGWALSADGEAVQIVTATPGEDIALYAVWEEHVVSGECGQNVTWTFDYNGTLTITGEGSMYSLSSDLPWETVKGLIKKVVIQDDVTAISDGAFDNCKNLTTVVIPDSVEAIGSGAFNNCNSLKTVCYTGLQNDWNRITVDAQNNQALTGANVILAYVTDVDATYTSVKKTESKIICSVFCQSIPETSKIFMCGYKAGKLVHVEIRTAGDSDYENFDLPKDIDNIKVFVFDGNAVLKPITVAESIEV